MTEGITEMEPSQRRLLPFVYDHLLRTGKWSPNRYVRVEMRDHGRLEVAAAGAQNDLKLSTSRPQPFAKGGTGGVRGDYAARLTIRKGAQIFSPFFCGLSLRPHHLLER